MHHKNSAMAWVLASALLLLSLAQNAPIISAAPHVHARFTDYYNSHEGMRVLGYSLTDLVQTAGYPSQYFEKGRIEDHSQEVDDHAWQFTYGRLTVEIMERDPAGLVSGTSITYGDLERAAAPGLRMAPPTGFKGGTMPVVDGMFVPFDHHLRPAPGYAIAPYFWSYINRAELFPGGWLHDFGLPLTTTFNTTVVKEGASRTIFVQAFERAVLTYDMQNPAGWQVEKGNIGADALRTLEP